MHISKHMNYPKIDTMKPRIRKIVIELLNLKDGAKEENIDLYEKIFSDLFQEYKNFSYSAIHRWIFLNYGRAKKCSNPECKTKNPKRFEWALKKGKHYIKDINNYFELCPSCHRKYDFTPEQFERIRQIGLSHKGTPAIWLRKHFECTVVGCKRTIKQGNLCYYHTNKKKNG